MHERDWERADAGFTLIELMISLLLFALIAVAGLALLDSVLGVGGKTEVRLDRLSALQRTVLVVSGDLEQVARGDMAGGGNRLSFTRAAPGVGGSPVGVRYALERGVLTRDAGGGRQALLAGVGGIRWRFFDAGWSDRWPPSPDGAKRWPRAVELELSFGPQRGLRRLVLLPARAKDVT